MANSEIKTTPAIGVPPLSQFAIRHSLFAAAAALLLAGCVMDSLPDGSQPDPDPDPPPATTEGPERSGCGSAAIACYDEFAQQPAGIHDFRPTSRWQKTKLTWHLV